MKIAVLSDIHGDFDKLKMILDQIQGADKLVLLGDLYVGGDFPAGRNNKMGSPQRQCKLPVKPYSKAFCQAA